MPVMMTNNAVSLLSLNLSATATTLKITSGDESRFPIANTSTASWFPVTVIDVSGNREIMRCTYRSGVNLTVQRAQEDTVARAFAVNSRVEVRLTAQAIEEATNDASNLTIGELHPARLPPYLRPTQKHLPATFNLNDVVETGRFWVSGGADNTPIANANGWLWSDHASTNTQHQEFQQGNTDERYRRQMWGGSWTAWEKIWNIKPDFIPTGTIFDYAGASLPAGWLWCAGQVVAIAGTYQKLYNVIGDRFKYTGDSVGSGSFKIPDLRGRVSAGMDDMNGTSANRLTLQADTINDINGDVLGAVGGYQTHTLTEAQLAKHDHTISIGAGGAHNHIVGIGPNNAGNEWNSFNGFTGNDDASHPLEYTGAARYTGQPTGTPAGTHIHTADVGDAGSGKAHNIVQPTIILNKIIKYL